MSTELRNALLSYESAAPDCNEMMNAINDRLDRQSGHHKRHAAMAVAAGAVVLAAAGGAYPALHHSPTAGVTAVGSSPAVSAFVPSVSASGAESVISLATSLSGSAPTVVLVKATAAPSSAPFSAGLMPTGWRYVTAASSRTAGAATTTSAPRPVGTRQAGRPTGVPVPTVEQSSGLALYSLTATSRSATADNSIFIDLGTDYPAGVFPLRVNGHAARIRLSTDPSPDQTLEVKQSGGTVLTVQLPHSLRLTDRQLLQLGASITVRSTAEVSHG